MKILVTGQPGVGKTEYLTQVAANEIMIGNKVLFITDNSYSSTKLPALEGIGNPEQIYSISSVRNWNHITAAHDNLRADTVILDGLGFYLDLNDVDAINKTLNYFSKPYTRSFFSVSTRKESSALIPGSSSLEAMMDRVIYLEHSNDSQVPNIKVIRDRNKHAPFQVN